MNICMLGSNSDIARELTARFMVAGDAVLPWARGEALPVARWDALVCAIGVLAPIGNFFELDESEWIRNVYDNALLPLHLLRQLWPNRNPGASVCFFSGAGVSRQARTYSGYAGSKAMLMKIIYRELLTSQMP